MNRVTVTALLAAATFAAASSPALADRAPAAPGEPFSVVVPSRDLDLLSPAGQAAFLKRAEALALDTCAPRPYPARYDRESLRACRAAFVQKARDGLTTEVARRQPRGRTPGSRA
jgi:UrcA family protein